MIPRLRGGLPPTLPRGITLHRDVARHIYVVEITQDFLEDLSAVDPWAAVLGKAIQKYHNHITDESMASLSRDDLDTLAKMIVDEMDRRDR